MFLWILVLVFFSSLAIACSSSGKAKKTPDITITTTDSIAGLNSIKADDCYTCHSLDRIVIGPSFLNIATRYTADQGTIDKLANKIIRGGRGLWGDIPMTPHPTMTKEDAAVISKYILSLKRQLQ